MDENPCDNISSGTNGKALRRAASSTRAKRCDAGTTAQAVRRFHVSAGPFRRRTTTGESGAFAQQFALPAVN
ncbi:hypothetical protein [Burkholderia pyrrocinia]